MANLQEKQIAQARPSNTSAASAYSPSSDTTAIIKSIIVCNTTTSTARFRIFHDDDGTTYDENTALFWDTKLEGEETITISLLVAMNDESGNLAVRTDTADALTFTVYGAEIT